MTVGTKDRFHPQIRSFLDKAFVAGARFELFEAEGQPHGFFNKAPWQEKTTAQTDAFLVRLGYLENCQSPRPPRPATSPSLPGICRSRTGPGTFILRPWTF